MSLLQSFLRRATNQRVQANQPQRPVPLQPTELKAVVGGSPRGTWLAPVATQAVDGDSPRGTW